MRRPVRLSRLGGGLLAFVLVAVLAPASAVACSCAADLTIQDALDSSPGASVIVGQVMRDRGDGSYDFVVARWYGPGPRETLILQSARSGVGDQVAFNTCGMEFTLGQRLLFLGIPGPDGRFAPSICSLSADPTTPGGAEVEKQVAALLGPPSVPVPQPSEPPPAAAPSGGPDVALVGAGIAGAVVLLFAGVILLGLRRRGSA
jgi:hypothetical protein